MECWNIRELIKGNKKKGNIKGGLIDDFLTVKELFSDLETKDFDYFSAGYMLGSSPTIKESFLNLRRINEKIRNNR